MGGLARFVDCSGSMGGAIALCMAVAWVGGMSMFKLRERFKVGQGFRFAPPPPPALDSVDSY